VEPVLIVLTPRKESVNFICSNFFFRQHMDCTFLHAVKLLNLFRIKTIPFSSLVSLWMLYFSSVRYDLEHASIEWHI
jgi:hypothetical protein